MIEPCLLRGVVVEQRQRLFLLHEGALVLPRGQNWPFQGRLRRRTVRLIVGRAARLGTLGRRQWRLHGIRVTRRRLGTESGHRGIGGRHRGRLRVRRWKWRRSWRAGRTHRRHRQTIAAGRRPPRVRGRTSWRCVWRISSVGYGPGG